MPRLSELSFVDLYIGPDFADVRGLPGALASRSPLTGDLLEEARTIWQECVQAFEQTDEPEFSYERDGAYYRVTVMSNIATSAVLFMRRLSTEVRKLESLGLPVTFVDWLMAPERHGLCLVTGEMGVGKTTTAAAIIVARLERHGGMAITVEDPPEIRMEGIHGQGRLITVPASRKYGNHAEQLRRAMRTGASTLMIGEIRDAQTAAEAIKHSSNGLFVAATVHGATVTDAIDRVIFHASSGGVAVPSHVLSRGITAVIHQAMHRRGEGDNITIRPVFKTLMFDGEMEAGMREKVRANETHKLQTEIEAQVGRQLWR